MFVSGFVIKFFGSFLVWQSSCWWRETWSRGYKTFYFILNSTDHEIYLAQNVTMTTNVGILSTNVGILTLISMINTCIPSERLKARKNISQYFIFHERLKFCAQLSWARKKFYNLEAWLFYFDCIFAYISVSLSVFYCIFLMVPCVGRSYLGEAFRGSRRFCRRGPTLTTFFVDERGGRIQIPL